MKHTQRTAGGLVQEIRAQRSSNHDTIYCPPEVAETLKTRLDKGPLHSRNIDSFSIAGLGVCELPQLKKAIIVCERGDIFPLAKDWKCDDVN
jgi:hypothetical protein